MTRATNRGCRTILIIGGGLLAFLIVGTAVFSLMINRRIPDAPAHSDTLTEVDSARVEEALHLRDRLGDDVWPGWGEQAAPLLVYNDQYAYLFDAATAPTGWETYDGMYRSEQDRDWQAFAEQLENDVWVGSMSTKTALDLFLVEQVGGIIPDPLESVVPLGLVITSTDHYITALLHEGFHAYQAEAAPDRFEDAEQTYTAGEAYEQAAEAMRDGWRDEGRLLAQALRTDTDEEAADLVRQWVAVREARRADLSPELVAYERRMEWLEGLAKYVELGIWEAAYNADDYDPLPALSADDRFHAYSRFDARYRGEVSTLRTTVTQSGDGRFYYTGMAQARLLDRLMPDWKGQMFEDDVWLEDLLADLTSR